MINIAGQLHAATAEGVLVGADEVKDPNRQKMQSVINEEVQQELGTKLGPTEYNELYDLACAGLVL